MKINLHNIYYYFLTCNNKIRKDHITKEFENLKLVEVNPIMNIGRSKSGATGFSRILDQACINQDKNKPFQPFAIFEDDVKKFDEFPLEIETPNDTDILYIGLSEYGMNKSVCERYAVCSKTIDDNIIRVYNMLAFHGIIVCSIRGLLTLQKCMFESYFKNIIWDIYTAQIQPYLNVYALKKPLVYQYEKIGGQEKPTKINYIDKADIPISKEWINKDNISILTMNQRIQQGEILPKDIILTWKNSNVPDHIIQKWKDLNPDFNIKFFDDNQIIEFLKKEYDDTYVHFFKCIKFGMYKADFFRYCYLYKYGGYYFDIDIEPILSIKEIIDYKTNYCSVLSIMNGHIFQAVLSANKNNPIIKMCINDMLYYGSNIGIDPPNKAPYNGHPTKCMYDNIVKYTGKQVLNEGIININDENILLGKEFNYNNRIAIKFNDKIFGYSRYDNYKRDIGFKENDINFIKIGNSETNSKTITLYKQYPPDTIITFKHKYKDTFDYKFEDYKLTITRTDENSGWGQDLVAYLSFSSNDKLISENKFSIFVIACDLYHYLTDVTFHFINENINMKSKLNVYYINETLETKMPNVINLMTGKIIINGKDSFTSRLLKGIKQINSDYVLLVQDDHWYYKNFLNESTINNLIEICYKYNLDQLKLTPGSYGTYKCKNYFNNDFEIEKVFSNECLYINNEFSIHWAFGSDYPMSHNPTIFKKQYLINNLEECIKNNVHTPWDHEIYNFKYIEHIKKYTNDIRNLRIACISKRYENQKEVGIVRHGKITDFGFKIINEHRHLDVINLCNINYLLKDLGPIEKKIHISWKKKDILNLDFNMIKYGIKQLKELNPEYTFEISDNNDVEEYINKNISKEDYDLIKDRNIVEKVDLWRLLKIYHEGGFYMDIDRLFNIPLKDIINSEHKCILPMYQDIDFSQDIMMSSSKNIIFKEAIDLNLKRRREGCTDILSLGPITYFHAVTKVLLGNQIKRYPTKENLDKLRSIISNCKYLSTFREFPPYNTLVYRGPHISFDKAEFYKYCDVNHWTKNNPNNPDNKPYGK